MPVRLIHAPFLLSSFPFFFVQLNPFLFYALTAELQVSSNPSFKLFNFHALFLLSNPNHVIKSMFLEILIV
ncbi:hypothetical protein Hdeb2414_s0011g00375341 [Helianthus debilis subsp. tardiflorus]